MPLHARRLAHALLAVLLVAACDDRSSVVPTGPQPRPLGEGVWYLNTVDDSALGSVVASRFVGAAEETAVIDSGRLTVNAAGSYEQRYWIRYFITGALDRSDVVIDAGEWVQSAFGYTFVSQIRSRTFEIRVQADNRITSREPFVFYANAPLTEGGYRRTRP